MSALKELLLRSTELETLYELSAGEVTPEIEEIELGLIAKVDSYAFVKARLELAESFWEDKANQAEKTRKAIAEHLNRFKQRLIETMLTSGIRELSGDEVTFKLSPTKGRVEIVDETSAKLNYTRTKVVESIDLEKIREDLENNVDLGCAKIVQTYSLRQSNKRKDK